MSDTIVLRKVYALNYLTGQFLSSGQTLVTDGVGGTFWVPLLSTLSTISTGIYTNSQAISSISTLTSQNFSTISSVLAQLIPSTANGETLASTVTSLGTVGYISSTQLTSTVGGLQNTNTVSSNFNAAALASTVVGLGTAGYVSTTAFTGFFTSTVIGLGTAGYISSLSLTSTVNHLGTIGYISAATLKSTIDNLGNSGYISSATLASTINSLGSMGFVSTCDLISTTQALSAMKANIRFDNTTTVNIRDANVTIGNLAGNVIYTSTIYASSITYTGNNMTTIQAAVPKIHELQFSTASLNFSSLSSFIDSNTRIMIDFYPTIAFTKLATGATNVALLPISSFLQIGTTPNLSTTTLSYLYAGNTQVFQSLNVCGNQFINGIDASNVWNQPFRMTIPKNTIPGTYLSNLNLVHVMPSSLNNGAFQNALHSNDVTICFPPTNSIFITIQNEA